MTNLSKPEECKEDGDPSIKTEENEIKKEDKDKTENTVADEDKKLLDGEYL